MSNDMLNHLSPVDLDDLSINTIRFLSIDAVQKANSGHPGLPMGAAPFAYILWTRFLKHNPANPTWFNRDRFVLSAGHGSMLLYSLLYLTGYDLPLRADQTIPPVGKHGPRASRTRPHTRSRSNHRATRPGVWEWRGDGYGGSLFRSALQPART